MKCRYALVDFLQKYEDAVKERSRLVDALHESQINATLELRRQHGKFMKEQKENTDHLLKKFDQFTEEANAWVTALNTSCEIIMTQLKQKVEEVKHETVVLQAKYDKREERIHALVMKQWQKLNRKVEEQSRMVGSNGQLKEQNYRFYGQMTKTEKKRAEPFTKWTTPTSK